MQTPLLTLRPLAQADIPVIQNWPPYPPEFAELDYALRDNGWIAELQDKQGVRVYVAEEEHEIVGFTLLAPANETDSELRIALRADKIGLGIGRIIIAMTLHEGFSMPGLSHIKLIVRRNNLRAIHLYDQAGFVADGECTKTVNGQAVAFVEMSISRPV